MPPNSLFETIKNTFHTIACSGEKKNKYALVDARVMSLLLENGHNI